MMSYQVKLDLLNMLKTYRANPSDNWNPWFFHLF